MALTNAERQARYRERRQAGESRIIRPFSGRQPPPQHPIWPSHVAGCRAAGPGMPEGGRPPAAPRPSLPTQACGQRVVVDRATPAPRRVPSGRLHRPGQQPPLAGRFAPLLRHRLLKHAHQSPGGVGEQLGAQRRQRGRPAARRRFDGRGQSLDPVLVVPRVAAQHGEQRPVGAAHGVASALAATAAAVGVAPPRGLLRVGGERARAHAGRRPGTAARNGSPARSCGPRLGALPPSSLDGRHRLEEPALVPEMAVRADSHGTSPGGAGPNLQAEARPVLHISARLQWTSPRRRLL